jgi:ABC-type uncharacterized transport system permease subunit
MRAAAIGLDAARLRLAAFTIAGAAAGLAGGLTAFSKGSVFPTYISITRSVDALLMVLLGGVQTIAFARWTVSTARNGFSTSSHRAPSEGSPAISTTRGAAALPGLARKAHLTRSYLRP